MDYFSRFLKKDGAASSTTTSITSTPVKLVPPSLPVEVSVPSVDRQTEILTAAPTSEEKKPHPNELKKEDIRLWDTKILKTVLPHKLVWAPLYRFRDQMFCARLVENDEIDRDLYIRTPLEEGESVVEFIRAPKTKACDTRLLIVHTKNIRPYYDKDDNHNEWSRHYLEKMRKVLSERWNKADTDRVYSEIVCSAQIYLKEALIFEEELSASIMRQRSPQYRPSKIVFEVVDEDAIALFGKQSSASTSSKAEPESLAVGNFVAYFSELNSDVVVYARIEGFSGDPDVPLVLSNGGEVHVTKRLRKLSAVPAEVNALGYEPRSGHYRNLGEYSWEGHDTSSQAVAVVDLTANTEEMEIEESSASTKKSTPASSKKGAKGISNLTPPAQGQQQKPSARKNSQKSDESACASAKKATPKRGAKRTVVSSSQESEPVTSFESTQDSSTSATSLAVTVSPPTSQLTPLDVDQEKTSARKRPRAAQSVSVNSPLVGSTSAKKEAQQKSGTSRRAVSDEPVVKRLTRSSK